jgi:protein SCO1/2
MPKTLVARIIALASLALILILAGAVGGALLLRGPADSTAGTATETAETGSAAIGGPFALTDQFGHRRTDADFAGQFMLVYFGFTYCPDVCPTELQTMTLALDALGPEADKVTPIFITVDPERDTVEQMRAYAENFHPRLVALTGTSEEIAAAAKAYRVYYARVEGAQPGTYSMNHSSFVYLMGPKGAFLTHFGPDTGPEEMADEIRQFL